MIAKNIYTQAYFDRCDKGIELLRQLADIIEQLKELGSDVDVVFGKKSFSDVRRPEDLTPAEHFL